MGDLIGEERISDQYNERRWLKKKIEARLEYTTVKETIMKEEKKSGSKMQK